MKHSLNTTETSQKKGSLVWFIVLTALAYVFGSASTIVPRYVEQMPCSSCHGGRLKAPLLVTLMVFFANIMYEGFRRVKAYIVARSRRSSHGVDVVSKPLLETEGTPQPASSMPNEPTGVWAVWAEYRVFALTGFLNFLGVILQILALGMVSASFVAGNRGWLNLFVALAATILNGSGKPQTKTSWFMLAISVGGTALIVLASFLREADDPQAAGSASSGTLVKGCLLCVGAALSMTVQYVVEAKIKKERGPVRGDAFRLMFNCSVAGVLITVLGIGVVQSFPQNGLGGVQFDRTEDIHCCIQQNPDIIPWLVLYALTSVLFTWSLYALLQTYGNLARATAYTARGLLTLVFELMMFAATGSSIVGQEWTTMDVPYCFGFIILISGNVAQVYFDEAAAKAAKQLEEGGAADVEATKVDK